MERVLKWKEIKKPGQYFIDRYLTDSNDNPRATITRQNRKLHIAVVGKCPTCGESLFGDFDYNKKENGEYDTEKDNIIDCPKNECEAQLLFKDHQLTYKGKKPKDEKKEEPKDEKKEEKVDSKS